MRSRDTDSETSASWFFDDQPIREAEKDRLDHGSVARVLCKAIESSKPPCMIGLLAEFGRGKSSTTNLAAEMLRSTGAHDVVTVTADKHSGEARARNLVHGIAAEIQQLPKIDPDNVSEILRPLRQATQVRAIDPTDTPWQRVMSGRYSKKQLGVSFLPFVVVAAILAGLTFLAEGWVANALPVGSGLSVGLWLLLLLLGGLSRPARALGVPTNITDHMPRAEAADEIEEVFGYLIEYHRKKRKRPLVAIIDDIDRLSKDDLLDALRVLRSLQSVPRGQEPVFVISCNESILTAAVGSARSAPASLPSDPVSQKANASQASAKEALEERDRHTDSHDDPALAFVDKLLTVRVRMPPAIRGDMRRFAQDRIPLGHPLRSEDYINLDDLLPVLIHDAAEDPRAVVRLLNGFIGAYLLGRGREKAGTIFRGDITHHPDVLAQLCVLVDEFSAFHSEVVAEPVLLVAARKVALRQKGLSPGEAAALQASTWFKHDDGEFVCIDPGLRHYLSSTARRVNYPSDISTLVYMTATPEGRALGQQMHSEIRSGVTSGDHELLADVVARVPSDQTAAAGQEIAFTLREASPADASTYLAAVAPILHTFEDAIAQELADSCVDLLDRAPDASVPAFCLTEVIDHAAVEHDESLCNRLLSHGDDSEETNDRYVQAARCLSGKPRIRDHVEGAILAWLSALPDEGSWDLGIEWLNIAESLDSHDYTELRRAAVTAMLKCVRSEHGFTEQDSDRLVTLASVTVEDHAEAAPASSLLINSGPNTKSLLVRTWDITGYKGDAADSEFAADTAADMKVASSARRVAVGRVVAWATVWESAEIAGALSVDSDDVYDVRGPIIESLVEAAREVEILSEVADGLPLIVKHLVDDETADMLLDGVVEAAKIQQTQGDIEVAYRALFKVVEASGCDQSLFDNKVRMLLEPIGTANDPADPAVKMALRLAPVIAEASHGPGVLSSCVAAWREQITHSGPHDGRAAIEGFKALPTSLSEIVEENAQQLLQDLRIKVERQYDAADGLRTMAHFPWSASLRPEVAALIDAYWNNVEDDTVPLAFELLGRTELESDAQARFLDRLLTAVEAEPFGNYSSVAARNIHRMNVQHRSALYVAAGGKHTAVTQAWIESDEMEAARTIAGSTKDVETTRRLFGSLSEKRRTMLSRVCLVAIVTTPDVPVDVINEAASYARPQDLDAAVHAALSELRSDAPILESALGVLHAAKTLGAVVETRQVTAAAVVHLPEASTSAGSLFGMLIDVRTLGRRLQGVLREMDQGSDQGRTTVEAFRAARAQRRRR